MTSNYEDGIYYDDFYIEYVDGEAVIRGKDGVDRITLSEYEKNRYEQRDRIAEALFEKEAAGKD